MGLIWLGAGCRHQPRYSNRSATACAALHHALERHIVLAGETGAVLVLGRCTLAAVGRVATLTDTSPHSVVTRSKRRGRQTRSMSLATNAVGRGFQKDNRLQALDILVSTDYL